MIPNRLSVEDRVESINYAINKFDFRALSLTQKFMYVFDNSSARVRLVIDFCTDERGYSDEEIAKIMGIKPKTVKKYKRTFLKRLSKANRC